MVKKNETQDEQGKARSKRKGAQKFTKTKKIPIEYVIELAEKGNTQDEISKILGCSRTTVWKVFKKEDLEGLEKFRKNEPKIWAYWRRKVLGGIKDVDIKNASLLQKVTVAGIMVDKEKILAGKTGEQNQLQINIEHLQIVQNAIGKIGEYEIERLRDAGKVLPDKTVIDVEVGKAVEEEYARALGR